MSNEVVMLVGMQASGKGTIAKNYAARGYTVLNRDGIAKNNTVASLLGPFGVALEKGQSVVLDNTFPKAADRRPFILAAQQHKVPIRCEVMGTSFADCQFNALLRMHERYGAFFFDAESIKTHAAAKKDPNIFPMAVLYKYRKEYEAPHISEGFSALVEVPFVRQHSGTKKALILDFDQNLRDTPEGSPYKYPTKPAEVALIDHPKRAKIIQKYVDNGYMLLGASNQSGIHKGTVTHEDVRLCFDHTCTLIGHKILYAYCPHVSRPIVCYCRKPNVGLGVKHIIEYNLDPRKSIFVGDQTSDKNMALGCGFQYIHTEEFFK